MKIHILFLYTIVIGCNEMESSATLYRPMDGRDRTALPKIPGAARRSAAVSDERLTRHTVMLDDLSKRLDEYFSLSTFGKSN
jgi:hypothetical protein